MEEMDRVINFFGEVMLWGLAEGGVGGECEVKGTFPQSPVCSPATLGHSPAVIAG